MSYSKEVYKIAAEKLNERRLSALEYSEARKRAAYSCDPRIEEIDRELENIGSEASRAVLSGDNSSSVMNDLAQKSLALQEEQKQLLAKYNFTVESLEPKYQCSKCNDTGFVELDNRTVICDCFKKLISDAACEQLNAISPLTLCTFESFDLDYYSDEPDRGGKIPYDRMSKIYRYCRDYADSFSIRSKSILMRGATGLGKTHLSLSIANELIQKGFSVVYVSAPDILGKLEREHFSHDYDSKDDTFDSLMKCDLLIIDDLGTEFRSQFSVSAMYNIFNSRILLSKPLILSTNLTLSELEEMYSQRFVSRLLGSCDRLDFIGSDIRPLIS